MKKFAQVFYSLLIMALSAIMVSTVFEMSFPTSAAIVGAISFITPVLPVGSLGIMLFTAPGGIATPFSLNLNFIPQFITFNNVVPLTSLRVSTKKRGVLHDFNAAMIAAMNGFMCAGALPANNVLLRLATGDIRNEDVTISGVTSAAGAINFFFNSDNAAPEAVPFVSKQSQILALTPTEFSKFTALYIPALAAGTDRVEVEFSSGHRQVYENQELQALSALWQQVPGVMVNNSDAYISKVFVICAAATPAYSLSLAI